MPNTPTQSQVLVLYSTRHGHTQRVAERVAELLRTRGMAVDLRNLAAGVPPAVAGYRGAVVAAPVHLGRHDKQIVGFVRRQREALERIPSAFVSVSLTQHTLEMASSTAEQCLRARGDLQKMFETFVSRSGWRPTQVCSVAGALAYTRYNWFVRWMMKRIARSSGGSDDTSRDHVYTDWNALGTFVASFAASFEVDARHAANPESRWSDAPCVSGARSLCLEDQRPSNSCASTIFAIVAIGYTAA